MALDRLTKVDGGGISTTSDYRVGIITASKFVGPFDGSGGNFSGVVTATNGVFSGNISAVDGNFSGNVSVGGTLTYEDVTNVDSVGLLTARSGIRIPNNTGKLELGSSQQFDLSINGSGEALINTTGVLNLATTSFRLRRANGSAYLMNADQGAGLYLYHNGSERLRTTATGIRVGTATTIETNGQATFVGVVTSRGFKVVSSSDNGATDSFIAGRIKIFDSTQGQIQFGTGPSYSPHQKYASAMTYRTNAFTLQNTGTTRTGLSWNHGSNYASGQGSVNLYYTGDYAPNYGIKLSTHSGGINITGVTTTRDLAVTGVSTFSGDLKIPTSMDSTESGGVAIQRFWSTGTITAGSAYKCGKWEEGEGALQLLINVRSETGGHSGTATYLWQGGYLPIGGTGYSRLFPLASGNGHGDGSDNGLNTGGWGVLVHQSGSYGFEIWVYVPSSKSNKALKVAITELNRGNNFTDLSASASMPSVNAGYKSSIKNTAIEKLYFKDNHYAYFGDSQDLQLYHDGSNSFIKDTGTGGLKICASYLGINNAANNEAMIVAAQDGAVELYHNGTKKLETNSSGIKIAGDIRVGNGSGLSIKDDSASETLATFNNNGAVQLYHNNVKKFETTNTGISVIGDIGSASVGIGSVFLPDDKKIILGNDEDLQIVHSSGNVSLITSPTSRQLQYKSDGGFLIRGTGNQMIANFLESAVTLYKSQQIRLTTTSTGITVGGEVAASQDYPNYQPTLDFNFAATKKLDPRITYQRTGPASFVNEFGKVVLVGDNAPRFDHDPTTRESKGLLSEPSRTNFLKYSVDFASIGGYDANYSNARSTLSSTTEVAPDGTNTASKYVRTAGQGTGEVAIIIGNTLGLSNGTVYTSSIFVKNVGTNNVLEFVNTRASDANDDSQFNLDLGTITTDGSNNSLTTITPYPNDWYRISVTATHNNLSGYFWVRMYSQPEGSGFIIWGGQVEAGRYPTSYIPTYNNAAVSRGEDLVLIDGTEFTDFFNTTEGTSVVHAHMPYSSTSSGLTAYSFRNSSNSNVALSFSRDSNSSPVYHYYHDGSNSGFSRASATADNMYKGALSFKTSDLDSYVNGSLNTNTTTFTMPTFDNLRIGGIGSENQLGGHVARFMYYPVKLTNNQLATLTS